MLTCSKWSMMPNEGRLFSLNRSKSVLNQYNFTSLSFQRFISKTNVFLKVFVRFLLNIVAFHWKVLLNLKKWHEKKLTAELICSRTTACEKMLIFSSPDVFLEIMLIATAQKKLVSQNVVRNKTKILLTILALQSKSYLYCHVVNVTANCPAYWWRRAKWRRTVLEKKKPADKLT